MKKSFITTIFLSICFCAFAQIDAFAPIFEVPQNYTLKAASDYEPYEKDVVNCVNWLVNTPIDQDVEKREEAYAFFVKWISGNPTVHVVMTSNILTLFEESDKKLAADYTLIFVGGWAKHSIETQKYKNTVAEAQNDATLVFEGNLAGIEAVIDFYKKNTGKLPKNKNIEKLIKLKNKGELKAFILKSFL